MIWLILNRNVGKIVVYAMNDDDDDANGALLGEGGGRLRSISLFKGSIVVEYVLLLIF